MRREIQFVVILVAVGLLLALSAAQAIALPVNLVAPGSLTGSGLITFDDVAGGAPPWHKS